jgi:periplasmic divalent cation tolerance protein
MIKTRAADYKALEVALKGQHPYELPEIIAVPLSSGLPEYLNWIIDSLEKS